MAPLAIFSMSLCCLNIFRKMFFCASRLNKNCMQRFLHQRKIHKLIFGVVIGFGVWISDFQTTMPPCHVESSRSEPHPKGKYHQNCSISELRRSWASYRCMNTSGMSCKQRFWCLWAMQGRFTSPKSQKPDLSQLRRSLTDHFKPDTSENGYLAQKL